MLFRDFVFGYCNPLRQKWSQGVFFIVVFLFYQACPLHASEVFVRGEKGSWYLEADGEPFYVKGVGCGLAYGREGEDYLRMAQELGANSVRTWGTDQGDEEYLDQAQLYGLKVAAGIWLNYVTDKGAFSYITDDKYRQAKRREALAYVKKFKDHPAILMWVVGNEAIFFTKKSRERIALCRFLNGLIKDIRKIDPDHPVIYASAGINDLKYLARYVPALDIIGINEYGSVRTAHGNWEYLGFDKPYLFTEFGPYLSLDRPRDINGCSIELSDENKAKRYKELASQIFSFKGYNLGGFAFHLGETTQESMTWWNLNEKAGKRASFWAIREMYTGLRPSQKPVAITGLFLSKYSGIKPMEVLEAQADIDRESDEGLDLSYAVSSAKENILQYYVNAYTSVQIFGQGRKVRFTAPAEPGVYRFYCFVKDASGDVASRNVCIKVE